MSQAVEAKLWVGMGGQGQSFFLFFRIISVYFPSTLTNHVSGSLSIFQVMEEPSRGSQQMSQAVEARTPVGQGIAFSYSVCLCLVSFSASLPVCLFSIVSLLIMFQALKVFCR